MNIYSDYGNGDHAGGSLIDALVFQEQEIGAANVKPVAHELRQLQSGNNPGGTTTRAFIRSSPSDGAFVELALNG